MEFLSERMKFNHIFALFFELKILISGLNLMVFMLSLVEGQQCHDIIFS